MSEPVIRTTGLTKDYHDGQRTLRVLRGVDLALDAGEIVAIVGVSGSGKSTLLNLLSGLDRPTEGSIHLEGEDLAAMSAPRVDRLRRDRFGLIFQFHHLLPELRAWENVAMPALIARRPRAEGRRRATELLERVGLADRANHLPGKLSGGEQQRVALARALTNDPAVILADEPTGNLDEAMAAQAIDLLWDVVREGGRADRVLRLHDGRLAPA